MSSKRAFRLSQDLARYSSLPLLGSTRAASRRGRNGWQCSVGIPKAIESKAISHDKYTKDKHLLEENVQVDVGKDTSIQNVKEPDGIESEQLVHCCDSLALHTERPMSVHSMYTVYAPIPLTQTESGIHAK